MKLNTLCQYIRNTGQVPLRFDDFDEDWSPVGNLYREMLTEAEMITEGEDGIRLTAAGEAEADKE